MKRDAPGHWKMTDLSKAIGLPRYAAVGLVEALWHATAKFAPHGDIGRIPNRAIAEACFWDGDPDALVKAFTECKFLRESEEHRYVVHDWHEHCEEWVRKRVERSGRPFASEDCDSTDDGSQCPPMDAEGSLTRGKARQGKARHLESPGVDANATEFAARHARAIAEAFDGFWRVWGKRVGKEHARRAFASACGKTRPEGIVDAAEEFAASPAGTGKFCPHPATWLNAGRWTDDRAEWWREGAQDARAAWLRRRHGVREWAKWTPEERVHWGSAFMASLPAEGSGANHRRMLWQGAFESGDPSKFAYAVVEYRLKTEAAPVAAEEAA